MEPIEVIIGGVTAVSIAKKISKYFLPPKAINPRCDTEYIGGDTGGTLRYTAWFEIPQVRRFRFRRKRALDPVLESLLAHITIDLVVEADHLAKSLTLDKLFDWQGLIRDEEMGLKPGRQVELRILIPIDLNKFILHTRPVIDRETLALLNSGEVNMLKIPVENTLSIPVRQYPIIVLPVPSQNLKKVCIRKGPQGQEREDELKATLSFSTRLFSVHGNIKDEFPDINTSQMHTWIEHKEADKETKIVIPVDLEKKDKALVILYFDSEGV